MSNPDWDTYYCKHCARLYGWLPAVREYREKIDKETIKYFTLSDVKAIDVFMLEMEEILPRDEKKRLPNVVICEGDPAKVAQIYEVVRPPIKEAVIPEKLQDLLTFQDDDYTGIALADKRPRSLAERKRRRTKQNFEVLKKYLPFDIINFDPNDNLFNPAPSTNRLYQAFENMFELQRSTEAFLLLVTTPIYDVAPGTKDKLKKDFEANVDKYTQIRTALLTSVKTTNYDEIDETVRIAHGFAKSIVMSAARGKGWNCEHKGIYVYENEHRNKYLSSAIQCSKADTTPDEASYVADVIRVINNMPKYYSFSESSSNEQVKEHLNEIVKFREESRKEYWTV